MKGIAILLMVFCHVVGHNYKIVYSFHMPLFFIVAGYFYKDLVFNIRTFKVFVKKNFIRLIIPCVFTLSLFCLWSLTQALAKDNIKVFLSSFFSLIWMSGDELPTRFGILCINNLWFLPALFWCKIIFYIISSIISKLSNAHMHIVVLLVSLLISFIISVIKPLIPPLPWCLIQGLGALSFFAIGWFIKRIPVPLWIKIVALLCWPFAVYFGEIGMMGYYYKIFPLDVLGACGATWLLYILCSNMTKIRHIQQTMFIRFLTWAGINSMLILCMHDLELRSGIIYSLKCRIPYLINMVWTLHSAVIHFCMAIILAYIVSKIPIISRIYK
jgi:fucose 4-O-acetylase-like acetyltransferase